MGQAFRVIAGNDGAWTLSQIASVCKCNDGDSPMSRQVVVDKGLTARNDSSGEWNEWQRAKLSGVVK
jgi:hypothetical protein